MLREADGTGEEIKNSAETNCLGCNNANEKLAINNP